MRGLVGSLSAKTFSRKITGTGSSNMKIITILCFSAAVFFASVYSVLLLEKNHLSIV